MAERVIRLQFDGMHELLGCFFDPAGIEQGGAVAETGVKVVRCHAAGVFPKREAVVPVAKLRARNHAKETQNGQGERQLHFVRWIPKGVTTNSVAEGEC